MHLQGQWSREVARLVLLTAGRVAVLGSCGGLLPGAQGWFLTLPSHSSGKKELPDSKELVEKVLLRRKFIPDPQGTNMMFAFFAQHFTHQFFKTDQKRGPAFTRGLGHGVRQSCAKIPEDLNQVLPR